jgi:transcriptional antiterminator NusG
MASAWYVLHTYSGYENRIEKLIRKMLDSGELDRELVREIKIPMQEITEMKDGKKRLKSRKFLPSYMLLEMDLPEDIQGWKQICSKINSIAGVTGFVGTPRDKRPNALPPEEARLVLQKCGEIKGDRPLQMRLSYSAGEQVKIIEGPFETFVGTIEYVNPEKNKLRVSVQIFGRATPVEVDILQVEKI